MHRSDRFCARPAVFEIARLSSESRFWRFRRESFDIGPIQSQNETHHRFTSLGACFGSIRTIRISIRPILITLVLTQTIRTVLSKGCYHGLCDEKQKENQHKEM